MFSNYHPHPSNAAEGGTVTTGSVIVVQNPGGADFLESNGSGALKVAIVSGASGASQVDDDAFVVGTDEVVPVGMLADMTTPDSVDEGDVGIPRMTLSRKQLVVMSDPASELHATIRDLAANDALNVAIVDGSGDQITSFGGGTQYTEDAASAANPVGTALILVREDGRAGSLTTTDGDNVAARGNNKGELYVKTTDSDALLTTIDADTSNISTKIDTLAGAVSGTEVQVDVLSSALPSGASTEAKQDTIITHVDGIEALLTTIDADTSNLSVVGGGTEAAAIRVTIANNSTGLLSVDDNGSTLSIDDGGGIITVDGTVAVTGVSTLAEQQTQTGHLATIAGDTTDIEAAVELLDDTVATLGTTTYTETTTKGLTIGAVRRDADTTLVDTTNEIGPLQMDANGRLKVEAFSGETLPVSVSGVATAANQATQITAEQAIQTATELLDDTVTTLGTTTYTEATSKGLTIGAVRRDADTTLVGTTNEFGPLQMDANGRLKVEAFSGEALPVTQSGTWDEVGINDSGNSITVDYATTGSGNATGALRVELPTNGTGVLATVGTVTTVSTVSALGTGTTGPQKAEDVASAAGDMGVAIMAARLDTPVANAAVNNDGDYTTPILDNFRKVWVTGTVPEDTAHVAGEAITVMGARRIDTAATSAGTSADWATVDASAEGALWVTTTPTTTSGCSIFRSLDLDETEEEIKATAGNLYGYYFFNATASVRYLKFYNATAANVTVGSTTPVLTFGIPASAAGHVAFPFPIGFGTAITAAVTTAAADADTGAPGAGDIILNCFYK